jgi:hypothetical protein
MQGRINSFEGAFYGMLFSGHLTIFAITFFFYNDSDPKIAMQVRKHIQVSVVQKSSCGSLYFFELHSVENRVCGQS